MRALRFKLVAIAVTISLGSSVASTAAEPARVELDQAVQFARQNQWVDALGAASRAIRQAPNWAEAYFVRAGVSASLAMTITDKLRPWRQPRNLDYTRGHGLFRQSVADLQRYLELTPGAENAAHVRVAIARLTAHAKLARRYADDLRRWQIRNAETARRTKQRIRRAALNANRTTAGFVGFSAFFTNYNLIDLTGSPYDGAQVAPVTVLLRADRMIHLTHNRRARPTTSLELGVSALARFGFLPDSMLQARVRAEARLRLLRVAPLAFVEYEYLRVTEAAEALADPDYSQNDSLPAAGVGVSIGRWGTKRSSNGSVFVNARWVPWLDGGDNSQLRGELVVGWRLISVRLMYEEFDRRGSFGASKYLGLLFGVRSF